MSQFKSFKEFYPFYLGEHSNKTCKLLHFAGTTIVFSILITAFATGNHALIWFCPLAGYFFAWLGHFVFEKNRPATFKYPFYSLMGDFVMFFHLLTGKLSFENGAKLQSKVS